MRIASEEQQKAMTYCKRVAREHGLTFDDSTLEYTLTNREFVDLRAKGMIPTMYDHWMDRVSTESDRREYEVLRHNPFETVINTRPVLSFYNDHNPQWLNHMIYYHVLGHVDFFQNNRNFTHTWNDDFRGKALADARHLDRLRADHGRWVDYALEFARSVDHLCRTPNLDKTETTPITRIGYLFERFLTGRPEQYALDLLAVLNSEGEERLFTRVREENPGFEAQFERASRQPPTPRGDDVLSYIMQHSDKLRRDDTAWMTDCISIVRSTAQYFQPQIWTKVMNEGWASYWHERLFHDDPVKHGHEADFAVIDSHVVSFSQNHFNPYALGLALFKHIEENADRGKDTRQYQLLHLRHERAAFDIKAGEGKAAIFDVRERYNDFTFLNEFIDQEFVDKHELYVIGQQTDRMTGVTEQYIKSRKAEDYRRMALSKLAHYPTITVDTERTQSKKSLNLQHRWEGQELHVASLRDALIGLEHLWGAQVNLRTKMYTAEAREIITDLQPEDIEEIGSDLETENITWTCKNKKIARNKGAED